MIAPRNKIVAHAFLLLFDNANDRLCQEKLLGKSEQEAPLKVCRPTVGFLTADSWPTVYQQLTDSWPTVTDSSPTVDRQ